MVSVPVECPYCHSTEVIKAGRQAGCVATFPLLSVPLCCSTEREVVEEREDGLQRP